MKPIILILTLIIFSCTSEKRATSEEFNFQFEGVTLNGIINYPKNQTPKGLVLIIHGSGTTNAVADNWHADIRNTINNAGYTTFMWDKMGCGKSSGSFNYNQSVYNSSDEVITAINTLKETTISGSERIGLWGISRAGWINPIVINKYKNIKFWISVSGVNDKENFDYLFKNNLEIAGIPKDSIALLSKELKESVRLSHSGATYETYLEATQNLRKNKFFYRFNNHRKTTAEGYYAYQEKLMKETIDSVTGLQVYVKDFDRILSKVDCPVLAIFGEKDKHVDWHKTKALYENDIKPNTNLTIKTYPETNHNLFKCHTGGFYEFEDTNISYERPKGYLEFIKKWLQDLE